jgi:hypothetical protein
MKKCKQCGRYVRQMRGSFCSNSCKLIAQVYYKRAVKEMWKKLHKKFG